MSLVITGSSLTIIYFLLVALNGFFCFKKIPILAFPTIGISIVFLIGFQVEYNGLNIILTLLLIIFMMGSAVQNWNEYRR
jgi:multidrug efflux pump subunit AcrB